MSESSCSFRCIGLFSSVLHQAVLAANNSIKIKSLFCEVVVLCSVLLDFFFCETLIFIQVGQLFVGPDRTVASNTVPCYLFAMKVSVAIFFFRDVRISKCRIFEDLLN